MEKVVDLSHPWNIHSPPWMGYDSPRLWYTQRHSMGGVVSQWLSTPLHVGTHLDSEMHGYSGGRDIGSVPIDRLYGDGIVVDISNEVGPLDLITVDHITKNADIRKGDILILHTGFHKYYQGGSAEDEETYFCRHPGPYKEVSDWFIEMELKWTGTDTGSGDHPMNTAIRNLRPDICKEYEDKIGKSVDEQFPMRDYFYMHRAPFRKGIIHVENVGGDIDQVLNKRCKIGAFPWRFEGGEGAMCRVVAFLDE